ncbi:hypothetical protein [Kribbella sp. NPDC050470]|uniref:hypothetical protein n=1 Tax=unclassified Kribbella TaxID=2644121 RepID=UPI0037A940F4
MARYLPRELIEDTFWVRLPPPARSMILFGLLFAFAALLGIAGSDGTSASTTFVTSVPWTIWRVVAGAALVVFVVLTIQAIRVLQHPANWGMYPSRERSWRYLISAAVGAAAVTAYRLLFPEVSPDLPIQGLHLRTGIVLVTGLLASIPWLTIVWLAHAECHDLGKDSYRRSGDAFRTLMDESNGDPAHLRPAVERLLRLWQLLVLCVGAFTVGVVAAVATSGALRGAFVAAHPDRAGEFPPSNVLLYGGMFALGLAVIAVPMALAWRTRAEELLDHACPLPEDGRPTEEWMEERHRIEHLLHLDISILRNPLTILSVIAPLLISALAAFLPQLAG